MRDIYVRGIADGVEGHSSDVGAFPDQSLSRLRDFVMRYQICWEVWPEYLIVAGKERQVGFELELSGTPAQGTKHIGPGCPACREVYGALHTIAEWILPKEERPSMYEVGPFQQALRYSLVRAMRPDVTLTVRILHRRGFDRPVDQCEIRCLEEMKQRLTQMGACQQHWNLQTAG